MYSAKWRKSTAYVDGFPWRAVSRHGGWGRKGGKRENKSSWAHTLSEADTEYPLLLSALSLEKRLSLNRKLVASATLASQ